MFFLLALTVFSFSEWKKNPNLKFQCLDLVWMILFPGHYEGTRGAVTVRERQSPQLQTLLLQSLILEVVLVRLSSLVAIMAEKNPPGQLSPHWRTLGFLQWKFRDYEDLHIVCVMLARMETRDTHLTQHLKLWRTL